MPQFRVMICEFPGNDVTHPDTADWVRRTWRQMGEDGRIGWPNVLTFRLSDTPITMSRNIAICEAIRESCDISLMIDNDMNPDFEVGVKESAKPFWPAAFNWWIDHYNTPCNVAAPYSGAPPTEDVYVSHYRTDESNQPNPHFNMKPMSRELAAQKGGFERVVGLATGLILIDLRVFGGELDGKKLPGKLPPPWFDYEYKGKAGTPTDLRTERITTEDYLFTRNCNRLGYPQWVAWDSWAGHWKKKCVGRPQVLTADAVPPLLREACAKQHLEERGRIVQIENGKPLVAVNGAR